VSQSNKIEGRIVDLEVIKAGETPVTVFPTKSMSEKIERPGMLDAKVYKIKPGEHAYYITISDIVLNEGTEHQVIRPYEIFINTKDMQHFQWVAALSRMISAVMRKGGDLTFAIEELRASFDPAGGHWVDGEYVPSIVAHVGIVIERHLQSLGLLMKKEIAAPQIENPPKGGYCNKCHSYSLVKQEGCDVCLNCGASKCG
jgi:hypothetical protein